MRASCSSRASPPCSPGRPPPRRPASPSSTRNRPCSPISRWPRTSSWGASRWWRPGVQLDPGRIARGLSIADQQIVEIAKALSLEARVIVMDEPTAALSAAEVARLFDVVRTLRAAGAAVLFISHRLEEVFEICQRVTVMRDGRTVLASELAGLTADDLVRAMVGRDMPQRTAGERGQPGDEVLRVERLTREGVFT